MRLAQHQAELIKTNLRLFIVVDVVLVLISSSTSIVPCQMYLCVVINGCSLSSCVVIK